MKEKNEKFRKEVLREQFKQIKKFSTFLQKEKRAGKPKGCLLSNKT